MNTLLLYHRCPETFWSFTHALRIARKKAFTPPLGLLTAAALFPAEWPKRLVDLNVTDLSNADLQWADVVLISAMTIQQASARALIARWKAAGKRVVAGGPLFTQSADDFPEVDHFVLDEGELTIPPFVADLQKGTPHRFYRAQGYASLESSPIPLWELADLRRYGAMPVQFSRGCPFDCDFCNVTALLGRTPRFKGVPQVIAELDRLAALKWRGSIFFVDDNLIGHRRAALELLEALTVWRERHPQYTFSTQVSINLADDEELLTRLVLAGFLNVFIGIETPCEESLTEAHKRQNTRRDLLESVRRLQRAGLHVEAGFIVGFDHDPPSIFRRQWEFIQQSGIAAAMVGLLQAPFGTRLYQRMKKEGRLLGDPSGDNVIDTTNIQPRMGIERLRAGYRALLQNLYTPSAYYARVQTFLREYRPPRFRIKTDLSILATFFRALYSLGIRGDERFQFWKLLVWTLFRRPRALPMAVTLAVYGHHFRRVCEEQVFRAKPLAVRVTSPIGP